MPSFTFGQQIEPQPPDFFQLGSGETGFSCSFQGVSDLRLANHTWDMTRPAKLQWQVMMVMVYEREILTEKVIKMIEVFAVPKVPGPFHAPNIFTKLISGLDPMIKPVFTHLISLNIGLCANETAALGLTSYQSILSQQKGPSFVSFHAPARQGKFP